MDRKIKLVELNPHLSCQLCNGYLIQASAIKECLHTFCKSCLVKHLQASKACPICDILIHPSCPLSRIIPDPTMQDIVFNLIPKLQSNEIEREKEFYRKRGSPSLKLISSNGTTNGIDKTEHSKDEHSVNPFPDGHVHLVIESQPGYKMKTIEKKFVTCSAHTTVTNLKKFIAKRSHDNIDRYKDIDVLCDGQLLGNDHTLQFVFLTRWRFKQPPLKITYRPRIELF